MGLIGQILGVGRAAEQIGGAVGGPAEAASLSSREQGTKKDRAAICRFFARGQCAKGSECRFLHRSSPDLPTDEQPCPEAASAPATEAKRLQGGEGRGAKFGQGSDGGGGGGGGGGAAGGGGPRRQWPELVGTDGEAARRAVEESRPDLLGKVSLVRAGSVVTADHDPFRVRVFVDPAEGRVVRPPRVG